jgi:ABC-2 type transport system permease protein
MYKETGENTDSQYLTISDPEEIKQIMKDAVVEEYSNMNPFIGYRYDPVNFSAVSSSDGSKIEIQYTISKDKLPETLKNEIQKIIKEQ